MTSFKFFAVICCAFLVFQAQAYRQVSKVEVEDDVMDLIKKVVKAGEQIIDFILSAVVKELERIDNNIEDIRVNATQIFGTIMQKASERVDKFIAKIGEDGNDDLKHLSTCFLDGNQYLISVVNTVFDTTSTCGSPDLIKIVDALKPLVADLKAIQEDAKAAADKIDDCSGDTFSELTCVVDVVNALLDVVKGIPGIIGQDVENAISVSSAALADYRQCLKTGSADIKKGIVEMINQISTCARS